MKKIANDILAMADKRRESRDNALNILLDCALVAFSHKRMMPETISEWEKEVDELKVLDYYDVLSDMVERVSKSIECNGKSFDYFGSMYEELFLSKGKASATGQFFTPASVSDLMAGIIAPSDNILDREERVISVSDPACGSGRTLLSAYVRFLHSEDFHKHKYVFIGDDIDPVSCKMCALNMMLHGMYGAVIRHDTLMYDEPYVVYVVNECRVPFNTDAMCIRALVGQEALDWWQNFRKFGLRLLTRFFDKSHVRKLLEATYTDKKTVETLLGYIDDNEDIADVRAEVKVDESTDREYVQLSLFDENEY